MILLPYGAWEIKVSTSRGKGFFTKKDIPAGTVIGDYLGKVLRNTELDIPDTAESFYLMYYHDRASIYPDLKTEDLHLINHSCEPNTAMYIYQGHTLFFALRNIAANEELTISYMLSSQDEFCDPCLHVCKCGSKTCSGTMHLSNKRYAAWKSFQSTQAAKSKRKRIAYNKPLKKLAVYPQSVADDVIYNLYGNSSEPSYICNEKNLLPVAKLRKLIRKTGKTLEFPKLNLKVCAVVDDKPLIGRLYS